MEIYDNMGRDLNELVGLVSLGRHLSECRWSAGLQG